MTRHGEGAWRTEAIAGMRFECRLSEFGELGGNNVLSADSLGDRERPIQTVLKHQAQVGVGPRGMRAVGVRAERTAASPKCSSTAARRKTRQTRSVPQAIARSARTTTPGFR